MYTIVSFEMVPASQSFVAIYPDRDYPSVFVAHVVVAFALYRDPDAKGSENVTAPLTMDDFVHIQSHQYANRRVLNEVLPWSVVGDSSLHGEVARFHAESGSAAWVKRTDAGVWEVQW